MVTSSAGTPSSRHTTSAMVQPLFKDLLASAEEELSKLKAMCVEGEETYAER